MFHVNWRKLWIRFVSVNGSGVEPIQHATIYMEAMVCGVYRMHADICVYFGIQQTHTTALTLARSTLAFFTLETPSTRVFLAHFYPV